MCACLHVGVGWVYVRRTERDRLASVWQFVLVESWLDVSPNKECRFNRPCKLHLPLSQENFSDSVLIGCAHGFFFLETRGQNSCQMEGRTSHGAHPGKSFFHPGFTEPGHHLWLLRRQKTSQPGLDMQTCKCSQLYFWGKSCFANWSVCPWAANSLRPHPNHLSLSPLPLVSISISPSSGLSLPLER